MVSRNNVKERLVTDSDRVPHYGIRKLSVGVASVLLGTTLYLGSGTAAHADTVNAESQGSKPNEETKASVNTHEVDMTSSVETLSNSKSAVSANNNGSDVNSNNNAASSATVVSDIQQPQSAVSDAISNASTVNSVSASNDSSQVNLGTSSVPEQSVQASSANKSSQNLAFKAFNLSLAVNKANLTESKVTDSNNVNATGVYVAPNQDGNKNKELVGTGKPEMITLSDGSSLTTQYNVLDGNNTSAILTFKSSAFKAGDIYTIKVPKEGGLALYESSIAKLQPAFGTTTIDYGDPDWYVVTNKFINSGTVSQSITLSRDFDLRSYPNLRTMGSFTKIVNDITLSHGHENKVLTVTNVSPNLSMSGFGYDLGHHDLRNINFADQSNPFIVNNSEVESTYELNLNNDWDFSSFKTFKIHVDKNGLDSGLVIDSVKLLDPGESTVLVEHNFDSEGNVEFTSDDFNKLSGFNTFGLINELHLCFHMHVAISDDKFVHHKYIIPINDSAITISAEDHNQVLCDDHPRLGSAIVLNDLSNFSLGDLLIYSQAYLAGYVDNDYSRPLFSNSVLVNNSRNNSNRASSLGDFIYSIFNNIEAISKNTNKTLSNFEYTLNIPDGLSFVHRGGEMSVVMNGGPGSYKFHSGDYITVKYRDGSVSVSNANYVPRSDKAISSISVHLADFNGTSIQLWEFSSQYDDLSFSKTYADGTPVQVGDLFTLTGTLSADGVAPQTVDLAYIRAADHNQNMPKGVYDSISVGQSDKTPGVKNAGIIVYSSASDSNKTVYPQYEHPVIYLSVPKNASLSDLSGIQVQTLSKLGDGSGSYQDLTPKSISTIKIDNTTFIKIDLSNYNKLDNGAVVRVTYDNLPDLQSSSEKTAFLVTADNLNDSEMENVHHYAADASSAFKTAFGKLIDQEKLDVNHTDYYESSNSDEMWDILTSDGLGSATMTSGNKTLSPSLDSKHDDHGPNADRFNIYGTTIDATDVPVRNAVQIINIPNVVDGTSQFNVQLTGPISLVNANTGADLSQLATIHYSTSRGNLSNVTVNNAQFTGGLLASQVTDWSKIQSVMIRFNSVLPARTSARAVLPVKDSHIYDHVGKTINVENVVYAYGNTDHNSNGFYLKPVYIKPGSPASAKLTVEGTSTITTWIHYQDSKGKDQYVQLPDKSKTYNELSDTMKRSDFMSSDSDLTTYDKSLLPSNLVIDWHRQPTIHNSSNTYLDGYQNGTAEFGKVVKYDFDGDRVVYEAGFTKQVTQDKTVKRTIHYKYADGRTAKPDVVQTSKKFTNIGFENPFTHQITWAQSTDNDNLNSVVTPMIVGYTSDHWIVPSLTVTPDTKDTEFTVVYNGDRQRMVVTYTDDTTGQTLNTRVLRGLSDESANYNTKSSIDDYKLQGYDLVSDNTNGANLVFDHNTSDDQYYEVHLKHHLENVSRTSKINETINYVYAKDHSQVSSPYHANALAFVQNGISDAVTKQTTWSPVASQQFASVASPRVNGYTADLVNVPVITVNFGDSDIVRTVNYVANTQSLDVSFIDDTTGQTLKTIKKSGLSDTSSNYNTKNDIDGYKAQHYNVVSDSTNGHDLVFDHNDNADQHYEVHLSHAVHSINESHDVSQVIHYIYADGSKAANDYTNQVHFVRNGYRDEVTNIDHWNSWTPSDSHDFTAVHSPKIKGFTPDFQMVDQVTVNPSSQNIEQTVTYYGNVQLGRVKYIDDSDNGRVMSSDDLSGHTGETDSYTTAKNIKHYISQGYVFVSDNYPATGVVFDNNDLVDQYFEVHFKHGTTTVIPDQPGKSGEPINPGDPDGPKYPNGTDAQSLQVDVPRMIDYVYQNGKKAQASVNDSLHFIETKVIDKVTGKVLSDTWSPAQNFETKITPTIEGYTPDRQSVSNTGINHDHPAIHEVVTYNPDAQKVVVKYIDDTDQKQLSAEDLTGYSDEDSGYNTKSSIDKYLAGHYVLVSDDTHGQNVIYDHDDKANQVYEVHFKHGTEPASESRIKNLTVHYVYADGLARSGQASADQKAQSLTFNRTGTKDLVTNNIAWNAWDHAGQTFDEIKSPIIDGYTPNQPSIKDVQVNANGLELTEKTVVYNADSQKLMVNFIDDVTGRTLETVNKVGQSDESANYDTKSDISKYIAQHYDLVSDDTNGNNLVFDHYDNTDQVYNVHLTHHTHQINDQVTKSEVIHYVYADGLARTGRAADDYHAKDLIFTRDGYHDEVTNEDHWNAWTPDQQEFVSVQSPKIDGYTADQTEVPVIKVNSASDNIKRTVTYNADKQKLDVVFIDDTLGKTLSTVTKEGLSDESANYNTKYDINHYKSLHYNVVSDGTQGQNLAFDHDDGKDQHYEVHLVHATHPIDEQVSTKQTIHYQLADGTKLFDDHTAQVDFSRDGYNDEVTNENHWNKWIPSDVQTFSKVVSPVKQGYTPDKAVVAAVDVHPGDKNVEETVIYSPDKQLMTINYIDDVTGKTLSTKQIVGVSDASANYNTKSSINSYVADHYKLVSDDTNSDNLVFDHDDSIDQVYNVHLTHTYQNVDDHKAVNETVHYVYDNGQMARPDYKAPAINFSRTGTKDLVTSNIVWNAWIPSEQSFDQVTTPAINGYTPDVEAVSSVNVNHGSADVERTVIYHADDQTILVNYIDDDTHSTLKTDTVIGKTAQKSNYTTKKSIDGYIAGHYELVSDDTNNNELVFDSDSTKAQIYNVHLKHVHQTVSDSALVNETIHYIYTDGSKARDDYHAPVINYKRTGDKDLVTNAIVWDTWIPASQDFKAVDSPVIDGYTPSQKTISSITVKPGDKDIDQTVVYAPDTQSIVVNYIDDVVGKTLKTDTLTGKSDRMSDYTTKNNINSYENQHYVLVSDETQGKTLTFDHDDKATQVYNVHLSHQTEPASQSRTVHETIDYVYADGSKAADTVTAKPLTFTQTGVKDLVTGNIDWNGTWTSKQAFAEVESPEITGYTASRKVVDSITVDHNSSDIHQTVIYVANDQTAKIKYVDDVTGKTLETDSANGKFGDHINFGHDVDTQIKAFEGQGYKFKSNSFNGQKYQADNSKNQFEVHFTHGTQNVSRTNKVTETVKYQFSDGRQAQKDHVQTAEFTQHGVQDLVTKTTVWTPSDPQTFVSVDTPHITGYTADVQNVPAATVKFGDADITKVVTYKANDQLAGIKYIDDTIGKTLDTEAASGKFGTKIEFMSDPSSMIEKFEGQGYKLVSNSFKDQDYQADNSKNQFEVHFTHGTKNVSRMNKVTETVKYQFADGRQAQKNHVQTIEFMQHGVQDLVTKAIDWVPIDPQTFTSVDTPKIIGYTADVQDIPAVTVKFGDKDIIKVVTYKANDQLAGIKYIDDTIGETLDTEAASGKFGTKIEFMDDPSSMVQKFEGQGYKLVSDNFEGQSYQADNSDNQFEVHFKHGVKNVSRTSTITRTIKYVDQNTGNDVYYPLVQTLTFTETGVTDLVTGKTIWETPSDQQFAKVESPAIYGYENPDIPVVDAETAKFGDGDQTVTVHYQKVESPATLDTLKTPNNSSTPSVSSTQNGSNSSVMPQASSQTDSGQQISNNRNENQLPQTGNQDSHQAALIGLMSLTLAGLLGFGKRRKKND